jgi:predicted DNA-binding ArsR family transcriptional regulator
MKRIKVINEPSELVPMLMAMDSEIKRNVFKEISIDWLTLTQIDEKFGEEGKNALRFLEKMKLVDTMWQTNSENKQEKAFHTYYMSFHINTSCPVNEVSDILAVAVMPAENYVVLEDQIFELAGEDGVFAGDITEKMVITAVMLKSLVKRSHKLEYRGHRIERIKLDE